MWLKAGDGPAWQERAGPGRAWPGTKPERWAGLTRSGRASQEAWISLEAQWEGNEALEEGQAMVWPCDGCVPNGYMRDGLQ